MLIQLKNRRQIKEADGFFLCDSKNKPPAMQGEGRSLDISNLLC